MRGYRPVSNCPPRISGLLLGMALVTGFPAWARAQDTTSRAASGDSACAARREISVSQTGDACRVRSLETVKVSGRIDNLIGTASSASEGRTGAADLRIRPITREGELLESVPGMIVTQHSGEGKANQYFVRGFNLDHGTDFQARVEGMPVNLPTHGHGQGYTDLNFLIPELVEHINYKLGVYHAEVGDFGSAGAAEFHLVERLDHPFATGGMGYNGLARLASGGSIETLGGTLLAGGEAKGYDGPWKLAEKIRKLSGVARFTSGDSNDQLSLLAMAYHNHWNSNDQIPARAVNGGMIDRFGQIDNTDGGMSERYSLSGSWRRIAGSAVNSLQLFGIYSDLTLFSDFTYFLDDPINGDQFSQHDRRVVIGGNATRSQEVQALGAEHVLKAGVQTRIDFIHPLGLYHTRNRVRLSTVREDRVVESGTGLFVDAESRWKPWLRTVFGLRGDAYSFEVRSDRPENSGVRTAAIASPKASLILTPSAATELYLSGGFGFHSNDARGTTITVDPSTGDSVSRVDPLVRSRGAELGFRVTPWSGMRTTISVWQLSLDSELLFTGDGGSTEPSAASRRSGITLANFYRPVAPLSIDADFSLARARFTGVPNGENRIPGALERVLAAGASWNPESGVFVALRLRHFGAYPLVETNGRRAGATTLINADGGYSLGSGARIQVSVLNLFDSHAYDIQYFYTSRLQGEPAGGIDDVHYHPIEPRQARASVQWAF